MTEGYDFESDRDPSNEIAEKFGYPPFLVKACVDEFDYACRLKTGELLYFLSADQISREWVRLNNVTENHSFGRDKRPSLLPPFDRGLEVRVDQIVWVADAPFGS